MLSVRLIALHSTYLNLINKLLCGALAQATFIEKWVRQRSMRHLLFYQNINDNTQKKAYKHIKTIAINKHPETLMQRFFFFNPLFSDCLFMKLYITPFCPKTFAEVCSKESERNCVDGYVAVLHQSFSTPVLQVLSDNEFVVKKWTDCLFLACLWSECV